LGLASRDGFADLELPFPQARLHLHEGEFNALRFIRGPLIRPAIMLVGDYEGRMVEKEQVLGAPARTFEVRI